MIRSHWAAVIVVTAAACTQTGSESTSGTDAGVANDAAMACTKQLPVGQLVIDETACSIDPETGNVDQCTFRRHDDASNQWIATCDATGCECRFVPSSDAGTSCATSCPSPHPQTNCCPSPWT